MRRFLLSFCSLMLIFSFSLSAQPDVNFKSVKDKLPLDPNVKMGKLSNGMTYYIQKNETPKNHAKFRLVIHTGSVMEDDDQKGLAHFCEHMAFNGTKNFPKNKLVDFLESTGIRFGADLNASTGTDVTMYELPIPMDNEELLKNSFQVLEDWAHNVNYDGQQIDDERGVIMSEWRQRNDWRFRLSYNHGFKIYKDSKYAERVIIGDTNIIQNCPHDALRRFYRDWYRPDLMAIIAVGDFDVNKIEGMIKNHFGRIKMIDNPRERPVIEVPYHKETLTSIHKDKEIPVDIGLIYFKKPHKKEETIADYRQGLIEGLYDLMFSSRLGEISQRKNPPFINASGSYSSLRGDKDAYTISVVADGGKGLAGIDSVLKEAYRVKQHGFVETEFTRAKEQLMSIVDRFYNDRNTKESASIVNELTQYFLGSNNHPGIEYEYGLISKLLPDLKLAEVNSLAKTYLTKDNAVVTLTTPDAEEIKVPSEKELLAVFNAASNRKLDPWVDRVANKPLFAKELTPGTITKEEKNDKLGTITYTLSNGAKVLVKETDFEDDQILFRATSPGGTSVCRDEMYLSASNATSIVGLSGVGDFDQVTLQKALAAKNVSLSPYINELTEGFNGFSTKKDLEVFMQLVHLYFTSPRLDYEAFDSYMDKNKGILKNSAMLPENAFGDTIEVTINCYHPRHQPITIEKLDEVDPDDAFDFYTDRFSDASDFTFIFVGSVELDKIKEFSKKYLATLPAKNRNEKWKNIGVKQPDGKIEKDIYKGEEDKSHVRMMLSGDFDWSQRNRYLLNTLVDVINIRLTEDIREKKGGVYSPGCWANMSKYPESDFRINIDFVCEPTRVDELVADVHKILEDLKENTDNIRVEKAQKAQLEQIKLNKRRNNYWLNNLGYYISNNEDINKIPNWKKLAESVKPEEILTAAKEYLTKGNIVKIVLHPEKS